MQIRRGDIYYADLSPVVGSEPVSYTHLVVANDGYMFPTLDLETDIGEKCLWRKGFA